MDGRASGVVVALPADDLGHDEYFYLDWLAQPELESIPRAFRLFEGPGRCAEGGM